jgi:tRNA threonylcarbamoyladenosine biosynthesis protein TsaB
MIVLGIETATRICGVGLAGEDGFIADSRRSGKTIHAEHLPNAVESILRDAGIASHALDGIAVSIGPGSFTGLRIGVGMAKGLAYGWDKPLVAVPTMDGLVSQIPGCVGWACVLLVARREEVYRGIYHWEGSSWKLIDEYQVIAVKNIDQGIPDHDILFIGEGATCHQKIIQQQIERAHFPPAEQPLPSGYAVAAKGRELLTRGKVADIDTLVPMYLKRFQGVA